MAQYPFQSEIDALADDKLLKHLCDQLEFVGISGYAVPNPTMDLAITRVQGIHSEIQRRGIDYKLQVARLGERRGWRTESFLEDCLLFPDRIPYVRDLDGIRYSFRCRVCRVAEYPPRAQVFHYCNNCLERVIASLREHTDCKHVFIFRTYSPECRCNHADNDTVLACDPCTDNIIGVCEKCIRDEIERRNAASFP